MLEKLSNRIASKIADNTGADSDGREVIAYGVMAIIHIAFFLLLISLLGLVFGVLMPILTICLSAALFRQHSGGAHALNSLFCTSIGCVVCLLLSLLCERVVALSIPLAAYIFFSAAALLFAVLAVVVLVPVDTPNKPITSDKKKKRMKRNSFVILAVYALLMILAILFGRTNPSLLLFDLCMCLGIGWQTFMLTKAGGEFLRFVQIPLSKLLTLFHP